MIYNAGEKPGKGVYRCTSCPKEVVLESDDDKLPLCPQCYNTEYIKVG